MVGAPDTWLEILARLGAAAVLGGVIGWDREIKGRAAGLRTHMLVALGAAAFIVTGLQIIEGMAVQSQVQFDPMRVVQGIAGGIGFLGAGAIIQSGGKVKGLTTAAGMWTCAAMGLAAGAGLYQTAFIVTALCLVILTVLGWVEPLPRPNGTSEKPIDSPAQASDSAGAQESPSEGSSK